MAKVELHYTPVEVAVAAFSTESSTMEELEWTCLTIPEILVRAFINFIMLWCVLDGKMDMYIHLELYTSSFECFLNAF